LGLTKLIQLGVREAIHRFKRSARFWKPFEC
jgi:hypothetical protein